MNSKKDRTIISYAAFILRQVYIQPWSQVLKDEPKFHELHICKVNLTDIKPQFYQHNDKEIDFYLV